MRQRYGCFPVDICSCYGADTSYKNMSAINRARQKLRFVLISNVGGNNPSSRIDCQRRV